MFYPKNARLVWHSKIFPFVSPYYTLIKKNHMILWLNAEKYIRKKSHLFMIKTLNKLGVKKNFLRLDRVSRKYVQIISNFMVKNWTLSPLRIRNKTIMSTDITSIQHYSSQGNKARKTNRKHPDWKELCIWKNGIYKKATTCNKWI